MKIAEKIEELNKYCRGSLTFTHYCNDWELGGYKKHTLFYLQNIKAKTFKGVVNKAYKRMKADKNEN